MIYQMHWCWTATNSSSFSTTPSPTLLDRQVPSRNVTRRRRPSNPWYDDECRCAKRNSLRSLERVARRTGPLSDTTLAAVSTWRLTSTLLWLNTRKAIGILDNACRVWTTTAFATLAVVRSGDGPWQGPSHRWHQCVCPPSFFRRESLQRPWRHCRCACPAVHCGAHRLRATILSTRHAGWCHQGGAGQQELPDKQCFLDPLPTWWLLKANVSLLVRFLCRLFNWSLQHGTAPSSMKSAYVTPILKKADVNYT